MNRSGKTKSGQNAGEAKRPQLQVIISQHCTQCVESLHLAARLAREFPLLSVDVIDLDEPGAVKPAAVFAVPTYLLEGRIVSLGNPYLYEIKRPIEQALAAVEGELSGRLNHATSYRP